MSLPISRSDAILILLYSSPNELNTTEIAKALKMYHGNARKLIKKLEKLRLAARHEECKRNRIVIRLTRKGKSVARDLYLRKLSLR